MYQSELVTLTEGKRKREELTMPPTYYAMVDHWIGQLGEKTYCAHMRLITLVDRRDKDRSHDVVKWSIIKLAKHLGMSKKTLLTHLKKLYEFGLIDYVAYADSKNKGSVPMNVVVFPYPLGKVENAIKPLVKLRDWSEYAEKVSASEGKGGRAKKDETDPVQETEHPPVSEITHPPVTKTKHPRVSKSKHINSSNTITNNSNSNTNNSKELVNKEPVNNPEESFRNDVSVIAFKGFYATLRAEYGMTKESFQFIVNKFVDETIRDNRHTGIKNLKAYVTAAMNNVIRHRNFRKEMLENVAAAEENNMIETPEEDFSPQAMPDADVPTDEELAEYLKSVIH